DAQALYGVCAIPAAFLIVLVIDVARRPDRVAVEPRASDFLRLYAIVFTVETIVDPIAGGPLLRWLGIGDEPVAMVVVFFFVLLGDFRVFVLLFGLAARHTGRPLGRVLLEAAAWTLFVPLVTLVVHRVLTAVFGELPGQTVWL